MSVAELSQWEADFLQLLEYGTARALLAHAVLTPSRSKNSCRGKASGVQRLCQDDGATTWRRDDDQHSAMLHGHHRDCFCNKA